MYILRYTRILDSVLDHASPEALLTLRATSRELHDEADARLFEHVSINETYRDGRDMVATVSPCGSTLTFEWMRCRVASSWNDDDLYNVSRLQRPRVAAARKKLREKVKSRLKATRVVDTHPWFFSVNNCTPEEWVVAESKDELFNPGVAIRCGTSDSLTRRVLSGSQNDFGCISWGREVVARYCDGRDDLYALLDRTVDSVAPEVVFHLLVKGPERRRPTSAPASWPHIGPAKRPVEKTRRVVVVGGAEGIRLALGLAIDATENDVRAALRFGVAPPDGWKRLPRALADLVTWDDESLQWLDSFRILSPEAYAAEVGERRVALETQSNAYSGKRAVYLA
jgi:hypothetical protein